MENSFYQVSEIEVSYRPKFKASERPSIQCSDDAYKIFIHKWNQDKLNYIEEAKMLLLNRRNRVLGIVNLSQGGVSGTIFDPKVIFGIALKANASGLIYGP